MYPGRYLKALDDVPREGIEGLTLTNLEHEEMQTRNGRERKWVLYFDKLEKGLVLNKTNATVLAKAFGPDSDDWLGRQVNLTVADVQFGSETVPAIRIVIPRAVPTPIAKKKNPNAA
jgi:hypothetical protein